MTETKIAMTIEENAAYTGIGRIIYISSHAKQKNLYAVYETADRSCWKELAKCNQEEFKKSGTGNVSRRGNLSLRYPNRSQTFINPISCYSCPFRRCFKI